MQIEFYKYQGTGNDFIIMDNRDKRYDSLTRQQVAFLCDRRFGIGADGLMLLNTHPGYDFEMKYYNSDGRESTMCGNGGRCLTQFAYDIGIDKTSFSFLAVDGPHEANINEKVVALKMNDVNQVRHDHGDYILNTGSPHYVQFTNDVMHLDVYKKGKEIRHNKEFEKEGINVNFVEQTELTDRIIVRTYERGVEDETFSCGTGVTAAALVSAHNDSGFNRVEVKTKGGLLSVEYEKKGDTFKNIWLSGPAVKVFSGTIEID
ncbi:diaminopimelate epimerase [Flavisolibacter ginsengisoli]|jgi:diaminopimelate epimerase|uniref:Diaminopimelate epimerase n=1 Tax=Flavisolibacter ginsengisoli DSM 18119 TaxID=1121884 RepID=A0A1M4Z417_9BACT|nr:diaminopimelate epimerase [Flavisolibacter ginsengisoli]SHF12336.1 diaminopimelate epimerase [Flavisolibacter ginsengisoli DSM 18119]